MRRYVEASAELRSTVEQAGDVLACNVEAILTDQPAARWPETGIVQTTLSVPLGNGSSVTQDVKIHAGPASTSAGASTVSIQWHGASHERLVPSFDGQLHVAATGGKAKVHLLGTYTVPLGPLGRFGDAVAGRRVARRSLARFLEDVARRIDDVVDHRTRSTSVGSTSVGSTPYNAHLREVGSDNYLG